jgi:signal transduction histidine kinase
MQLFPTGITREVLQHFLDRQHHRHWPTRVFTAFCIAVLIYGLEGGLAGILAGIWCIGAGALEYVNFRHRSQQLAQMAGAGQDQLDHILAQLFSAISLLGAYYAIPVLALTLADHNGKLLGLILSASILMNIAGQHVIHPRLVLFSLPFPAIAFFAIVVSLASSGSHPWILWLTAAVFGLQTALLTLTATRSDRALIDARRLAIEEAAARGEADDANQAKSNFLNNISHELRTPLNAVIGYGEILRESAQFEGRISDIEDIDKVLLSGTRLLQLVNEILDMSKIAAGGLHIEHRPFDIGNELRLALDMAAPIAMANQNVVTAKIAPDLGQAVSDPLRFNQCVLNLLSNAAKFTHDGAIYLEAVRHFDPKGDTIIVSVSDTGIGISREDLKRLFKPFTQVDDGTARKYDGAGLGLALTRELARLMGGDVSVTSSPGKGSRFSLTISVGAAKGP